MILDPESNNETVLKFVGQLLSKLDQLHAKAVTYKNYQKTFKVIIRRRHRLRLIYTFMCRRLR